MKAREWGPFPKPHRLRDRILDATLAGLVYTIAGIERVSHKIHRVVRR